MEVNLSKTCRACLKKLAIVSRKLSDPMRHENESVTYLDAFVLCTGFSVESTESQELCDECASELFISFNFKEKCTRTQKEMQKWLMSKIKQEEEEEDFLQAKLEVFADSISIDEVKDTFFQDEDNKTEKGMPKNGKSLECDLCGIYVICLLQHYNLKHEKLKTVPCPHCNLKQYPQLLDTHIERCRTRRKNERKKRVVKKENEMGFCPICGVIKSKLHINSHLLQRSNKKENTFICDICGIKMKSKRRLVSHMQIQHLKIPFKCRYCSMEVRNSQLLDTHKRLIHPEIKSVLKCEYCEYTTVYHGSLRVHRAVPTGKKNHKCDICQRSFAQKARLTDHRAIHFDERPFACDRCGTTIEMSKETIEKNEKFQCSVCLKFFNTYSKFYNHAKSHEKTKKFKCDHCAFTTTKKYNLKEHSKTHLRIKIFICDLCNKNFSRKSNLKAHLLLHLNKMLYCCSLCDKKYLSKHGLDFHHERIHNKSGKFACDECNKTFFVKLDLTKHKKVHSQNFEFECNLCFAKFHWKCNLTRHYKVHQRKMV